MFQIFIEPGIQACEEEEKYVKTIFNCSENIKSVIRVLERMSGFEEVIAQCRKVKLKAEDEKEQLECMTKQFGNILLSYSQYENRIQVYGEDGFARNRLLTGGIVDIRSSEVSNWNIKID